MAMERFAGLRGVEEEKREIRLPIGFRFRPTDEELLVHYLKRRALSLPLPASIIPEFDVFRSNPWDLPGDLREKKRFYFTRMVEKSAGVRHCTATSTSSGFWKAVGKPRQILSNQQQQQQMVAVGTRKLWVFYQEQHSPHGWFKTNWYIHEFHLPKFTSSNTITHQTSTTPHVIQNSGGQIRQDWIVCKVFQRKRKHQNKQQQHGLHVANNKCIGDCNSMPQSYIDFKLEVQEEKLDLGPPEAEPCSPSSSSSVDHPMFS